MFTSIKPEEILIIQWQNKTIAYLCENNKNKFLSLSKNKSEDNYFKLRCELNFEDFDFFLNKIEHTKKNQQDRRSTDKMMRIIYVINANDDTIMNFWRQSTSFSRIYEYIHTYYKEYIGFMENTYLMDTQNKIFKKEIKIHDDIDDNIKKELRELNERKYKECISFQPKCILLKIGGYMNFKDKQNLALCSKI